MAWEYQDNKDIQFKEAMFNKDMVNLILANMSLKTIVRIIIYWVIFKIYLFFRL